MTGKFKDYRNGIFAVVVTIFAAVFLAVFIKAFFDIDIFYAFICSAAVYVVASMLLARGSFTAYGDKVFFRLGFMQYVYSYAQIVLAETKTGFYNSRLGRQPYIVISIKLTDGSTVTFYDESLSKNALSTPEKCRELQENHQFAQLSRFINDRTER
ncbi:MAG: hypothetical protein K2N71_07495 [Oscillospiraceae bacterium]|nr:hypothetical protein [Oscillospiraceae bacterium]